MNYAIPTLMPIHPWEVYVAAFVISVVSVFFKAFQNRNFNDDAPGWLIWLTSMGIAACELCLLAVLIHGGLDILYILVVGTGAAVGGKTAMQMHTKFIRSRKR